MKRHPFRWDALIFGLVFLAVVGTWLTRTLGWFTTDQLAYVLAGALIAVGIAGIMASLATRKPVTFPATDPMTDPMTDPVIEEANDVDETIDSQP